MKPITTEITSGEIKITFGEPKGGKLTLASLGANASTVSLAGGKLRLDIELGQTGGAHFFKSPTVFLAWKETTGASDWQVDFNGSTVVEKQDHGGHNVLLLLDRKKMQEKMHHHENRIVVHGELGSAITLDLEKSYISIFETPGS